MAKPRKVLQDHKKVGKVLVPPFTAAFGPIQEISWIKEIIPELVAFGLVQTLHGDRLGVELLTALARSARRHYTSEEPLAFGRTSDYQVLSESAWSHIQNELSRDGALAPLNEALAPLVAWYPQCPLISAFPNHSPQALPDGLRAISDLVGFLYDRKDRRSMMIQATSVWLAFDADLLKVQEGLALAQFPEIENYPDTPLSQQVGSGVRAVVNMLMAQDPPGDHKWPSYFWNRGLEISPCEFNDDG